MIKRANTPANPSRPEYQNQREAPRRIFGKDLKNIITNYHNKFNQCSKSANRLLVEQGNQEKSKFSTRNNSQRVLKREATQSVIKDEYRNLQAKKSTTESTEASPKSITIKDYLKSKAPKAISQISSDLSINYQMRELLVLWLIELTHKLTLKPETRFHCILMFDQMLANYKNTNLSGMVICLENLQLLALACLFISAKYEQIYTPHADLMVKLADYSYSKKKIIEMEATILLQQQFSLTFPTRHTFLQQSLNQQNEVECGKKKRIEHMALFLLQLSLLELWQDVTEQQLAQAAIFLAKKVVSLRTETPNRKICQIVWKLIQCWKSRRNSAICYIFDSDKYSFVGGIYLEDI